MAASPKYKVYNASGEYIASCRYASDAAMIVNGWGEGATIRLGHGKSLTLWTEGKEDQSAGESYDYVADICMLRERQLR